MVNGCIKVVPRVDDGIYVLCPLFCMLFVECWYKYTIYIYIYRKWSNRWTSASGLVTLNIKYCILFIILPKIHSITFFFHMWRKKKKYWKKKNLYLTLKRSCLLEKSECTLIIAFTRKSPSYSPLKRLPQYSR